MALEIGPPRQRDLDRLVDHMREADIAEVRAAGFEVAEAVQYSVDGSTRVWAAWVDGDLACVFGVAPVNVLAGQGAPWMLGTPLVQAHARLLMRTTPAYVRTMQEDYPVLVNFVHRANRASVRWLKAMGFKLKPAVPYGPYGELFHPFEMRA